MPKPITLDHLRSKKKPVTRKAWIALDDEVAEEFEEANAKAARLEARHRLAKTPEDRLALEAEMLEAQEAREAARERLKANAHCFPFHSINPRRFDELVTDHPPTDRQLADVKEAGGDPTQLGWNPDTFAPVLVAECCSDPVMTAEEAQALFQDPNWNGAELGELFQAALQCNMQRRQIEMVIQGNGSGGAKRNSRQS